MARGKAGIKEKEEWLTEAKKLIRAGMIIDLYCANKDRPAGEQEISSLRNFNCGLTLPQSTGNAATRFLLIATYEMIKVVPQWQTIKPDDLPKYSKLTYYIGRNATHLCVYRLLHDKKNNFLKRFQEDQLKFTQNTYTDEEVMWASHVLKEEGFDLAAFHLDEMQVEIKYSRIKYYSITETHVENCWVKSLEAAKEVQAKKLDEFKSNKGPYVYWRSQGSQNLPDKPIEWNSGDIRRI